MKYKSIKNGGLFSMFCFKMKKLGVKRHSYSRCENRAKCQCFCHQKDISWKDEVETTWGWVPQANRAWLNAPGKRDEWNWDIHDEY